MRFSIVFGMVTALILPGSCLSAEKSPPRNIVLMIADDLGMEVGCYGDRQARTPNIGALAKKGVRFRYGFAAVSSCSPSRATLYTGLHTHTCGQYGLAHAAHNFHSRPAIKSLPSYLRPAGYQTAIIGKTHILPKSVYDFDEVIPASGRNGIDMARKAEKFISSRGDKPFCLVMGYTDPHRARAGFANDGKYPGMTPVHFTGKDLPLPAFLPDLAAVRGDLADYYESVNRLDQGVGAMMSVLKKSGHDRDTLVLFLSDNGIPFPGAKTTLYDPGIHLPLIVSSPTQSKQGLTNDAMVSWIDILPTMLAWAQVKVPASLQGRSFLSVLEEESPKGWDEVFASQTFHEVTMYYPMRAVRTRQFKYIRNLADKLDFPTAEDVYQSPTWQAVLKGKLERMGKRTVKQFVHRPAEELYDLSTDPAEVTNLAGNAKYSKTLADLRARVKAWQAKTMDPWVIKDVHE